MATKKKTTVETDKPAKTVKAVKATAKTTAAKSAAPVKAVKEAKASKTAACNKALKEAAELAPLVQSAKDGTGENTSIEDAQKAAEFLMNNYEKSSEEKIIVDGIVIPTQAELLNMPESDYMNERQQAFFKHLCVNVKHCCAATPVQQQNICVTTPSFPIWPTAPRSRKSTHLN